MLIPCEIAVKSVIPAIKAAIAKELVETYGLTQNQAAEILGISQSAVSKYTRKVRGYLIKIDNIEEIQPLIENMINLIIKGNPNRTELLKNFCQTCATIRKEKLMCPLCQKTDPKITIEKCNFCQT